MEKLYELHSEGGSTSSWWTLHPRAMRSTSWTPPEGSTASSRTASSELLLMPTRAYLKAMTWLPMPSCARSPRLRARRSSRTPWLSSVPSRAWRRGSGAGRRVEQLLADPGTAFVLVTAPREDSIAEARFFARRLGQELDPGECARGQPPLPELCRGRCQRPVDTSSLPTSDPGAEAGPVSDPLAYEELREKPRGLPRRLCAGGALCRRSLRMRWGRPLSCGCRS